MKKFMKNLKSNHISGAIFAVVTIALFCLGFEVLGTIGLVITGLTLAE